MKLAEALADLASRLSSVTDEQIFEALESLPGFRVQLDRLSSVSNMARWLCPECGMTRPGRFEPDCPVNCDSEMVKISTAFYAELAAARAKRGE